MNYNQFQRTRLLLGDSALKTLRDSHVMVIGCGAVGSFAIEALARAGIGHLTLVDGDTVQETNINRQLCATYETLNQSKADVLKQRIHTICPDTQVSAFNLFFNSKTADEVFKKRPDFVIDAIDILSDKTTLILYLQKKNIPFISSMGAALKTDFNKIKVAPLNQTSVCPLASRLRKLLKEQNADLSFPCIFSTEKPIKANGPDRQMGSLVSITGMFGLILANETLLKLIQNER